MFISYNLAIAASEVAPEIDKYEMIIRLELLRKEDDKGQTTLVYTVLLISAKLPSTEASNTCATKFVSSINNGISLLYHASQNSTEALQMPKESQRFHLQCLIQIERSLFITVHVLAQTLSDAAIVRLPRNGQLCIATS